MNQGKIIVGIAVALGICAGLAGYWWNYGVSRRAMEFWGQENARLIRLAPKVEYLLLESNYDDLEITPGTIRPLEPKTSYAIVKTVDLSQARGLIHLRNAILSDDQYEWDMCIGGGDEKFQALRFTDQAGNQATVYFTTTNEMPQAYQDINKNSYVVALGPLAKSLEQFLARELPRLKAAAEAEPIPAKSE
jgi:hypothetical protein